MCGIAGILDLRQRGRVDEEALLAMTHTLVHRGPDSWGVHREPNLGLGLRRLEILDLETGDQPIYNEDRSVVVVCNGEIFNYQELRRELQERGHRFRSKGDIEVLVHLYEEEGLELVYRLNGQFAFALYDIPRRQLFLARDHFGINPLFHTVVDGQLLFASEVKGILAHPSAPRRIDPQGLDQVLSLPGLVSPRTLFEDISSLPPGHRMIAEGGAVQVERYWDLNYPRQGAAEVSTVPEEEALEELGRLFRAAVRRRLRADVPVGLFLSGGLDSSLVGRVAVEAFPGVARHSFSVTFGDAEIDEGRYQRRMAEILASDHHEIPVDVDTIAEDLRTMVRHCECPVRESFNTCALALSRAARAAGVPVVLAGQGADELFGGYPGYRFDAAGTRQGAPLSPVEEAREEELRERLWGDPSLFYEQHQLPLREVKGTLYSRRARELFARRNGGEALVDAEQIRGRHPFHQRSYLDFKLRLADHLLSDHGDRMVMAHSVEGRYPFLDQDLVSYVRTLPPAFNIKGLEEKHAVKRMARGLVPSSIIDREKFGFRAPGTPILLQRGVDWVEERLDPERVRRRGAFDPAVVSALRDRYSDSDFRLQPHLETDWLMVVLTFDLLCEEFEVPGLD